MFTDATIQPEQALQIERSQSAASGAVVIIRIISEVRP